MAEPSKQDELLLEEMLENYKMDAEAESATRTLSLDDLKFEAAFDENGYSTHWTEEQQTQREKDDEPTLTLDHLSQFPKQVVNEFRQMRLDGHIHPVDNDADPATAEVLQGISNSIKQTSHASVAYETGFDFAVKGGFGFWRVITKYTYDNPKTEQEFKAQHIEIKTVKNPFTVLGDSTGEEPDGSDWERCTIAIDVPEKVYRRKYKNTELANLSDWASVGTTLPIGWLNGESARVAEYFYAKHKDEKAVLLSNGDVVLQSVLDGNVKKYGFAGLPPGEDGVRATVVKERMIDTRTLHWIKTNGKEILERTDWPGKYIPVIPIYGSEYNLDGKLIRYGMIRNAKDAQRGLDYMFSAAVGAIGLVPKAPYIYAAGQIEQFGELWALANKRNFVALPYRPVSIGDQLAPPPQRNTYEPAIMAILSMISHFQYTLKATQGMYGSSLGEPSGEKSGLAIQTREAQGNQATFHFQSNAERSIWHTERIILDLIPKTYDDQTVLQIMGKDDKQQTIILDHNLLREEREAAAQETIPRYNITAGRYDVTISVEQNYATQRQESVAKLSEIIKTWGATMPPPAMQVLVMGLLKNVDIPGGKEIAEKIEKLLGPLKEGQAIPPEVQQQMQAMDQQLQLMAQELQKAKDREIANTAELQSRENIERTHDESQERIAAINAEVKKFEIRVEAAAELSKLKSSEAMSQLDREEAALQANIDRLREDNQPAEEREPVAVP